MIRINELEDNIIDLNGNVSNYELTVESKDSKGKFKAYDVDLVTNDNINVSKHGQTLLVTINIEEILKEETIVLINTLNERLEIKVLPNSYYTMDKNYKFKITKKIYDEDGSLKVKILSTMNDEEIGWRCTYDGKPMSYFITPLYSNESGYVVIKQKSNVFSDFDSLIEFTQAESGEVISLNVHNTPDGIKKKVD